MGIGGSKDKKKAAQNAANNKPKTMPYKRQFSSDVARQSQQSSYKDYRQSTLSVEDTEKLQSVKEEKTAESNKTTADSSNAKKNLKISAKETQVAKYDNDILDPKKYKPPPSPAVSDLADNHENGKKEKNEINKSEPIKEEDEDLNDDEDSMTDAQALQIKMQTERGLSPGTNVLSEDDQENAYDQKNNEDKIHKIEMKDVDEEELIKQTSAHSRVESKKLDHSLIKEMNKKILKWGYCELTRKQLDEDQAAFLTWTHPTDGFVHAWAIFDGHGGYETALYSSQHFLKYVQKYHLTRKNMKKSLWAGLMKEIFLKFDEHIGNLNIRGGSTVIVVLLIGNTLVVANAGDARAIMSHKNGHAVELSYDHTPMNDYDRLEKICKQKEHYKKISRFFRINAKHETYADVQKLPPHQMKKAPFISREQDKSRLLGTIGVARGFGDFNLSVFGFRQIKLKPYLSAEPYVVIKELNDEEILDTDIMVVACDGVFDVITNQEVIDTLRREMFYKRRKQSIIDKTSTIREDQTTDDPTNNDNDNDEIDTKNMYLKEPNLDITENMIDRACGFLGLRSYAKGTMDDVSVFAVPLRQIFDFCKLNGGEK